jgi:hypothetical protein
MVAPTCLDVVADDGQALVSEALFPLGAAGDEHGHAVHHGHTGLKRAFHVEFGGGFRTDGQEVHQNLGAAVLDGGDDAFLGGFGLVGQDEALVAHAGHVVGHAVQDLAHDDLRAAGGHVGMEHGGAVGACEDGFGDVLADLALVDIDAEHEVHVTRAIAADAVMDQTFRRVVGTVIGNALNQRAGAIAHADHGDLNRFHQFDSSRRDAGASSAFARFSVNHRSKARSWAGVKQADEQRPGKTVAATPQSGVTSSILALCCFRRYSAGLR